MTFYFWSVIFLLFDFSRIGGNAVYRYGKWSDVEWSICRCDVLVTPLRIIDGIRLVAAILLDPFGELRHAGEYVRYANAAESCTVGDDTYYLFTVFWDEGTTGIALEGKFSFRPTSVESRWRNLPHKSPFRISRKCRVPCRSPSFPVHGIPHSWLSAKWLSAIHSGVFRSE